MRRVASSLLASSCAIGALVFLVACGSAGRGRAGAAPARSTEQATWLCRPDLPADPCRRADLRATELRADGSRAVIEHRAASAPEIDCFYVYPTVDLELVPGNHLDLSDTRRPLAATLAQAARFTEACRLWVPLYRQVTLGMWLQPKAELERGLAVAFADVERAFREWLAQSRGRRLVLIGHSQGAEMVVRLLRRFFDPDPEMRRRLVLALAIGGEVDVARGRATGGTFASVPICTQPLETGCVVAYRTHAAAETVVPDRWAPPPGRETACVNPAALDGGDRRLAGAVFPARGELGLRTLPDVATPYLVVPDLYAARCERGARGYAYLAVAPAGDPADARGDGPVDLSSRRFRIANLGLHLLDLQLPQRDLVDLVSRRAR